jgi:hypothetical protein
MRGLAMGDASRTLPPLLRVGKRREGMRHPASCSLLEPNRGLICSRFLEGYATRQESRFAAHGSTKHENARSVRRRGRHAFSLPLFTTNLPSSALFPGLLASRRNWGWDRRRRAPARQISILAPSEYHIPNISGQRARLGCSSA